jgi:hypothetical protein
MITWLIIYPKLPVAACYRKHQRAIRNKMADNNKRILLDHPDELLRLSFLVLDTLHQSFWFVPGSRLRTLLIPVMRRLPQVKVLHRPSRVLRNTLKMQVLVLNSLNYFGTMVRDMAALTSWNGPTDKDTPGLGTMNNSNGDGGMSVSKCA